MKAVQKKPERLWRKGFVKQMSFKNGAKGWESDRWQEQITSALKLKKFNTISFLARELAQKILAAYQPAAGSSVCEARNTITMEWINSATLCRHDRSAAWSRSFRQHNTTAAAYSHSTASYHYIGVDQMAAATVWKYIQQSFESNSSDHLTPLKHSNIVWVLKKLKKHYECLSFLLFWLYLCYHNTLAVTAGCGQKTGGAGR